MSINDFLNKIKGEILIDRSTILCLCIIVLVGLGSFGLGRLFPIDKTDKSSSKLDNENVSIVKGEIGKSIEAENTLTNFDTNQKEKMYVASKNGKLYYSKGCSGTKRIKLENQVWFASKSEAEDSGFSLSTSCK